MSQDQCAKPEVAVTPAEQTAELEAVLSSKMFSRGRSLAAILSYTCRELAQGRANSIKEYNIAVEALGRSPDFDPLQDSIVRVEVSKLRKRLQQYYETEGADHEIQIRFSDVGYTPRFVRRKMEPAAEPIPAPGLAPHILSEPARGISWRLVAGIVLLVLCAAAGLVLLRPRNSSKVTAAPSVTGPAVATGAARREAVRIACGSMSAKYVDSAGHVWQADQYFTGGTPITRPDRRIFRTHAQPLYQTAREGNFQYDIPLGPGTYELHLHFAEIIYQETLESSGDGWRRFQVELNGKPVLSNFDVTLDAPGVNTADEKVFRNVEAASDGFLHLRFTSFINRALVNGIEILPATPNETLPIRILAGRHTYYDRQDHFWATDRFFERGTVILRSTGAQGTPDAELFSGERFGHFSYWIPVPDGRYTVTLNFSESNFGVDNFGSSTYRGGQGSRVFDVFCNGTPLLKNFDILREAGGPNRPVSKIFRGLRPTSLGKVVLDFVPVVDYATVRSIEVVDEGSR